MAIIARDQPVSLTVPSGSTWSINPTDEEGRPYLLLGLSEDMHDRLEQLAMRAGVSKADIIERAIGTYKVLSDAVNEGKRVGVVADPEIELDTELVGF